LLANLLLDIIKASAPARIINVNSDSHQIGSIDLEDLQGKKRYGPMRNYGQSKFAMMLFSYELARRLQGTGVTVNCLHPGFVATNIAQRDMPPILRAIAGFILPLLGISPEEGAKTSLYLASSPAVEHVTGKYFVKSIPIRSVRTSYDESLQRRVWEESAKLVQLPVSV
jgi:NAD(P)-dependent dehydrogenase (short-subunit alcohol dehydrogenase family)